MLARMALQRPISPVPQRRWRESREVAKLRVKLQKEKKKLILNKTD